MMLLDELIRMMIGMTDDQLHKIKNFILTKLSIKKTTARSSVGSKGKFQYRQRVKPEDIRQDRRMADEAHRR